MTLQDAMQDLGGPDELLTLLLEPDPEDFQPELLSDELISDDRLREIRAGSPPTSHELSMWRDVCLDGARSGGGDGFHTVSTWRLPVPPGQPALYGALHEDHGVIIEVLGPFHDLDELRATLAQRGIVEG